MMTLAIVMAVLLYLSFGYVIVRMSQVIVGRLYLWAFIGIILFWPLLLLWLLVTNMGGVE